VTGGRLVVVAVGAAALLVTLVPGPASAVDAVESGWWSRGNGGGPGWVNSTTSTAPLSSTSGRRSNVAVF
jgi:hypothetical protein